MISARSLALAALVAGATSARAQVPTLGAPPRPEFRADLLGPAPYAIQLGAGINVDAGYYARVEFAGAGGALRRDGVLEGTARGDAILRLLLDPFAESRWGLSLGGGATVRYEAAGRARLYLVAVLDLEGPPVGNYRVAYQAGLGGGLRVGMVVRRMREVWR